MEKHRCKLCSRSFANGRALGGHMKAHLAILPLPPKKTKQVAESASSSSSSSSEESKETEEKSLGYGLRENPKKSFRLADPEFSFAADSGSVLVAVKDGESDTESRNPAPRRSKRVRKPVETIGAKMRKPSLAESEPASSVSDTSPEEDVAMCLIMLSKDKWKTGNEESAAMKKKFRSCRKNHKDDDDEEEGPADGVKAKIFECPFCFKVFESGQALGGHKRAHLLNNASSSSSSSAAINKSVKVEKTIFIDLNLPAPAEEDEYSVVSDAEFVDPTKS